MAAPKPHDSAGPGPLNAVLGVPLGLNVTETANILGATLQALSGMLKE